MGFQALPPENFRFAPTDSLKDIERHRNSAHVATVAAVVTRFFQNHHERALCVLVTQGGTRNLRA